MPCSIESIHAREVFDSRGKPTVEVEIRCRGAQRASAIVPSGASTGRFEAVELRDRDSSRLGGNGVLQAVRNVRDVIAPALLGMDADDQAALDRRMLELDGTGHKSQLGANAILGVSLAAAHAAANAKQVSLVEQLHNIWSRVPSTLAAPRREMSIPLPMVNMISGGLHAGGNLDIQDFLIMPVGAGTYRQALDWIVTVYHELGRLLREAGFEGTLVGDEGGYGPKLAQNDQALEFVVAAIGAAGLRPREDVAIALDIASSHFYRDGYYQLAADRGARFTSDEMIDLLAGWVDRYPIVSIEDGLAEDDWPGWARLTERLGARVQLIGDDLFVTNKERLRRGIESRTANCVLVKVNQIGTLTETFETLRLALDSGYRAVISARSGETEDCTIADLAVATGAGQIKIGSVARSERLAKYNQLLRLEERLGRNVRFADFPIS
ncbi:MAG: phosphopyruvate hydratase [Planctomycetaceae bacterium]